MRYWAGGNLHSGRADPDARGEDRENLPLRRRLRKLMVAEKWELRRFEELECPRTDQLSYRLINYTNYEYEV